MKTRARSKFPVKPSRASGSLPGSSAPGPSVPETATGPSWIARAGFVASALAVFACGWLGMKTDDWRKMIAYAVLAIAAAALATAFRRRA